MVLTASLCSDAFYEFENKTHVKGQQNCAMNYDEYKDVVHTPQILVILNEIEQEFEEGRIPGPLVYL